VQRFETNLRIPGPTSLPSRGVPDGIDRRPFKADLQRRRLVVAGGQGQLKGSIFRIGHLGDISVDHVLAAIGGLEEVSLEHGRDVVPGSGVAAAQRAALEAMANGVLSEVGA
jgi:aspartate aminotransferase-like enzyme